MTTENALKFLQLAQEIANMNNKLLESMGAVAADINGEPHQELMQASKHLMQAQSNVMKAVNK